MFKYILEKIKQIFREWFLHSVDGEIEIKIPYKYQSRKIKVIKIVLDDGETFIYHED